MPLLAAFTATGEQSPPGKSDFLQRLELAPVAEQRELLMIHVRQQIARVLGLTVPGQIGLRQSLFDLGIDSLMALELKNSLESSLGHSIRSTVLFNYPTLEELVDYLGSDVLSMEFCVPSNFNLQATEQTAEDRASDRSKDRLKEMSQDEIANLFAQKLASFKEDIK